MIEPDQLIDTEKSVLNLRMFIINYVITSLPYQ